MVHGDDSWLPDKLQAVVAAADPIPFDVLQSLRACFAQRSREGDLAELVYDSVVDETAGVRAGGGDRQLSFHGDQVSVEMAVAHERGRVLGQLVPAVAGEVEIRQTSGSYVLPVDELGRFVADGIPKGPVSFRCRGEAGGRPFVTATDWVVL
jgi:hypothetical protein